jgi:DNA gyrase subunit B
MRDYLAVKLAIDRLARRFDPVFLNELVDHQRFSVDWGRKEVQRWCDDMLERLAARSAPSVRYELAVARGEEGDEIVMRRITHGVPEERRLGREFFEGPEYRLIGKLANTLHALIQEGAVVRRGKAHEEIASFAEAFAWLMAESRKGRNIQRFKGLGEMNPDQLWDTTVNPETRRLLKVTIEDAVAADEIFTTLMGDEVEPRREFIEKNALDASNLDV